MGLDAVEDRLDYSAPPVGGPLSDAQLRATMRRARKRARRDPHHRWLRPGVTIGLIAALLAGTGVAVAQTVGWGPRTWLPRYESPDASFSTTLPSGRTCEVRAVAVSADGDRPASRAQSQLRDWLSRANFPQSLDLAGARREDAARAAALPDQTVALGPNGLLMDVPRPPSTRTPDDVQANVIELALENAIVKEAAILKVDLRTSTVNAVVKCDPAAQ